MTCRLLPLLVLAALGSCASPRLQQTIHDQDEQLSALSAERRRLIEERDRLRAENARLEESVALQLDRNQELEQRVEAMEASQKPGDAEVDGLRDELAGTGVGVSRRGEFIVLELPEAITFPSGSADLSARGKSSLAAVSAALKTKYAGQTLWIEGHTDDDPIRRSKWDSNLHLSAARALAVAGYLSREQGVDPAQVRVAGYGEHAPKTPNTTPEAKAANRRVEILILP